MAEYRIRGLPPALWRRVRDKAGPNLKRVLISLLRAYADDTKPTTQRFGVIIRADASALP